MHPVEEIISYYDTFKYTRLSQKAYDIIVELIITLNLQPGQIYSENEIINLTGIGRTPVREALKLLEFSNLVAVIPRSGIQISDISNSDYRLKRDVRCSIDELVMRRAAQYSYPHERQSLQDVVTRYSKAVKDRNIMEIIRSDMNFHNLTSMFARNPYAKNLLLPLVISECRLFYMRYSRANAWDDCFISMNRMHLVMMQKVIDGDGDGAVECLKKSVESIEYMD